MSYLEIPVWRVLLSSGLVALAIGLSRVARLDLERDLALGGVRAAVQLLAVGYALRLVVASNHPALVLSIVALMALVAAWTSVSRLTHGPSRRETFAVALAAVVAGALAALVPVFVAVVEPKPWFDARYVIPIGGMMLSSAMNVVALVLERIFAAIDAERAAIEQRLSLGADGKAALAPYERAALRAALLPTINGLVTVGLVALPGMMTGQIVSGVPPELAVRYQVVIMYQLVAVAAVSGAVSAVAARRLAFDPWLRLRTFPPRPKKRAKGA
jgi:putative ABC transport system permease protein